MRIGDELSQKPAPIRRAIAENCFAREAFSSLAECVEQRASAETNASSQGEGEEQLDERERRSRAKAISAHRRVPLAHNAT